MPLDLEPVLDLQPVEGLDLQEIPASIPERAANAGKAFAQGVTTSVGQSISGVARTADTIQEGQLGEALTAPTATTPTRRSFVRSMEDPRYMSALLEAGDDPALLLQAQSIFGPMARQNKQEAASLAQQKRLDTDSPLYQFGKGVVEAGREIYPTNPALDAKPESKLARSLGSTLPSVGLGLVPIVGLPAAVSQYALSQSEDMAQEAIDANRPDLAMQAASIGLFIGALSEATLGASARLKSLLKNPTRIKALEGWAQANPIKARALIIGAREAAQEGVEQGMQNVTASDLVGYDPDRPWHRQVLESMALGGAGGLIFGGGGALVTGAGRKTKTNQPDQDEAEALAELNAALDAFQTEPEAPSRVTELQTPPPAVETRAGETVLLPTFEPERLTPEQQMAREAANAMAELRALKAAKLNAAPEPLIPANQTKGTAERPAQTIEAQPSPATESPAVNVRKGTEMPAEAGATPAPEPASQRRAALVPKLNKEIETAQATRKDSITVTEHIDEDTGSNSWVVDHPDSKGSWSVYEWNGEWMGDRDGSIVRGATRELAIEKARERLKQEVGDQRGSFGINLDTTHSVGPLFQDFDVPEGADQTGWERTKWGSWYNTITLEDGTSYKLSVRDHDASRKDMGLPDKSAEVSKNWMPQEVAGALDRLEQWLFRKANAPISGGAAGIKTRLETQSQGPSRPSSATLDRSKVGRPEGRAGQGQAGKGNMAALRSEESSALTAQTQAQPDAPVKRRPSLGQRPDGVPDVLDAIADLGGIKAPGAQKGTGEYDGYAAAFNEGGPAAVLRGGTLPPDRLVRALQDKGFRYESIDEMYDAVSRANAARDALTQQIKQQRTVRPEMVDRVQKLYDAVVAGQPVTQAELGELDSRLTERERKMLTQPLKELGTMADVAPATDELSPIEAAKADVRKAWGDLQTLGIIQDPKRDAEKAFALYKALFKLATAYAKKGMKTAAEFAAKTGLKLDAIVQAAWEDAVAGKSKPNAAALDVAAVTDLTDNLRQHKFSQRIAPDLAPQLATASAGNVHAVKPMALTAAEAYAHVKERGLVQAAQDVKDEGNELTLDQRVAIAQAVITQSNHAFAKTGDQASFDAALDMILFTDEKLGLETGRGLNAFKLWNRLSPDGYVREYVRTVNKSARRLGIPANIDKDLAKKIRAAAQDALAKPAGFQQDEALIDVMAMIARAKGIAKLDVATALYYANILSGWTTHARNLLGNVTNLFSESIVHAAVRPQHVPAMLMGIYNGMLRGAFDAGAVLRTGKITGTRVQKNEAPRALELIRFGHKGGLEGLRVSKVTRWLLETKPAAVLNAWKYVGRIMNAADMMFFRSAQEMKAHFQARELARTEKLSGPAFARRLTEVLHNTPAIRQQAAAQATQEGLTGNAHRRRVAEIIEQGRPESLVQQTAEYGRFTTFTQEPEGVLGAVANAINQMSERGWGKGKVRYLLPAKLALVPFTRTPANVFNQALNFTPWGYARLFAANRWGWDMGAADETPLDYQLQFARATLGTVGIAAILALIAQSADDDDPAFNITAKGPADADQRKQLKETGWDAYSVKIGSGHYSYRETPMHLAFAAIGNYLDAVRYKKLDERDALIRWNYALQQTPKIMLDQAFLSSLSDFFAGMSRDTVPRQAQFPGLGRTIPGALIPNLVKQVDRLFDPTVYDASTIEGAFLRDVPVARSAGKPLLNLLGEPVRIDQNPFYSAQRPDELWTTLAGKQAWISTPNRTMLIGDRPITPEEYYEIIATSGPAIRRRLEILTPYLSAVPDELAQKRVDQITREERAAARRRLGIAR